MSGWFGDEAMQPDYTSKRKWAWWPTSSTESGEPNWLKPYWRVETDGPDTGSKGQGWITKIWRLTEEEYLLYILSKSPA